MSKTTDGIAEKIKHDHTKSALDALATKAALDEQARDYAQRLILEENMRLAEINARQAQAIREAQEQAARAQSNIPQNAQQSKDKPFNPAVDIAKGAVVAGAGAAALSVLGPAAIPAVVAGRTALERILTPKNN